jgi:hypothetical protein
MAGSMRTLLLSAFSVLESKSFMMRSEWRTDEHLRVARDHSGIGESHRQRCAALDAGRAVADHSIEFTAQLLDHAGDALLGQRILVAGLRGRQEPQRSRLSRMRACESFATLWTT